LTFDWDDANRYHVARHNVTALEAEQAFINLPIDIEEQFDEFDGWRYLQVGETNSGRILVFLSIVRNNAARIISAWDAPKGYKDFYLRQKVREQWKDKT
jgi:uncharacterized DUF497 family protein